MQSCQSLALTAFFILFPASLYAADGINSSGDSLPLGAGGNTFVYLMKDGHVNFGPDINDPVFTIDTDTKHASNNDFPYYGFKGYAIFQSSRAEGTSVEFRNNSNQNTGWINLQTGDALFKGDVNFENGNIFTKNGTFVIGKAWFDYDGNFNGPGYWIISNGASKFRHLNVGPSGSDTVNSWITEEGGAVFLNGKAGQVEFSHGNGFAKFANGQIEFHPDGYAGFGNNKIWLFGDGNATFNGSVWCAKGCAGPSDSRLKKDIKPITGALEMVEKLQGVRFNWRAPSERTVGKELTLPVDKPQVGFIGQDVEKVLPEAVGTESSSGTLALNESKIVPLLVEAVKELKKQNETLKKEIEQLKAAK